MECKYKESSNDLYNSIIWTHKIQRTYLEILELRRKVLSIIALALSALTSISTLLSSILAENKVTIWLALATLLSIIFSEVLEKIETKENINKFRKSSSNLWVLKQDMKVFRDEIKSSKLNDEVILVKLQMFQKLFDQYTSELPTIPNRVVDKASKKINERKDEETEIFLL